jgi:hypothetical protein
MASHTISGQVWPDGTEVGVYLTAAWTDRSRAPSGAQVVASQVVADGEVTFTGLTQGVRYVAWAEPTGVTFLVAQSGLQAPVSVPDRERIKVLEVQGSPAGSGSSVNYVATDADLPADVEGFPVLLVLEDSENVDADGNPQATLRYWTGSVWMPVRLGGGGTVGGGTDTDYIVLDVNLSGRKNGDTLIFDDDTDLYIPGGLS